MATVDPHSSIFVWPPGTHVRMGQGMDMIDGIINMIRISGGGCGIEYNVAWWVNGNRYEAWVHPCEFDVPEDDEGGLALAFLHPN